MTEYAMVLKNGKDIIHRKNLPTLEEAKKYFAGVKQMPLEEFNKIFIVLEVKK